MNSFFKSSNSFSYNRENTIKESLINSLSENAKEIQFEFKENGQDYLELTECTNSLCTTLEAIFLHGLKDSFLWQTINLISGDVDRRPEPSFWSPLLVFLHKQVIEQIHSLSQINSEIGHCRSFIRLSLNDSLFSSYMNNIRKNSSALNPYYKKCALLRDNDRLEMAAKILEGIETCVQINLPINSSLLNQWGNYALQLAGIWAPPLRSCPIASGIDVASSITDTVTIRTPKPLQANEFFSESISNSPFNYPSLFSAPDLTEREHLQILLEKVEVDRISEETQQEENNKLEQPKLHTASAVGTSSSNDSALTALNKKNTGNSLGINGWSSTIDENTANNNNTQTNNNSTTPASENKINFSRSNSLTTSVSSLRSPVDRHSYNTLLVRHEKFRELDWNDVWERFENSLGITGELHINPSSIAPQENSEILDFDDFVPPHSLTEKFTLQELHIMVEQLCKLAIEPGLNAQGFVCKSCAHPLGIGFAAAQVCSFSGHYFCEKCMSIEQFTIPAKIIYNWDFRKFAVSKRASSFLLEFQSQPFIDLKLLNPDIYMACDEMAGLQSLRIRLNFIRAYLFTCRESIIEDLQKLVMCKEYLYEHIHQYSIADLNMIQKGALAQLLQKTVSFGEQHILSCRLCKVKGFICEVCNSPKVLYPFDINTTFRLLNPDIYMACDEMAGLQSLRIRLNFIRAYLFTCRESIIEDLQKLVMCKEYLYEHIHQYSIADLNMIQKGALAQLLQKTVSFGEQHILSCRLCKVKGFICEVCNSPKVLYPFDINTTFRCQLCGAVYHDNCLNGSQPCPKCERKRKREDLPLFEAVHML